MSNEPENLPAKSHSPGRIIAIVAVVVAFIGLLIADFATAENPADKTWNPEMTVGSAEPTRLYVMYTDLACPYCDVFSREVMNHWDEFLTFLDDHHIIFEIRLTETLFLGNSIDMSRDSAEAAYCAKRENKFWEYYHEALSTLWDDYHSKGIAVNKTAPQITNMPDDYWLKIGHAAGLGDDFDNCVNNRESAEEALSNTQRALKVSDGMPTFRFGNSFKTSGFSDTWDWEYVKMYLEAGLK